MMSSLIFQLIWLVIALTTVFIGYFGRSKLLAANECKMTMTTKGKDMIPVVSIVKGPKLYKYQSPFRQRKNSFNKQPVIFVPGHLGE